MSRGIRRVAAIDRLSRTLHRALHARRAPGYGSEALMCRDVLERHCTNWTAPAKTRVLIVVLRLVQPSAGSLLMKERLPARAARAPNPQDGGYQRSLKHNANKYAHCESAVSG
jgi:hypothetical protein